MLDSFPDNKLLTLTEVAKLLDESPERILSRKDCCRVLKIQVRNCTKHSKKYFLSDNRDICTLPDERIFEAIIPVNANTINDIRKGGAYSTSVHEIMTPDSEGFITETYVSEEDSKIEATVETLWMTAHDAKALRKPSRKQFAITTNGVTVQAGRHVNYGEQRLGLSTHDNRQQINGSINQVAITTNGVTVQAGGDVNYGTQRWEPSTHDVSQQMPFTQEPTANGKDEIMADLGLSWNTCKLRMKEYGITGPRWVLPWSISTKIKASNKG